MWWDWHPIDDATATWIARAVGSAIGVLGSLVMIAPESSKNALYRAGLGFAFGLMFAPVIANLPFAGLLGLDGESWELAAARATIAGLTMWFILEGLARFVARRDTFERLLRELLRLKGGDGEDR